jgi:hypothetical protein
MKDYLPRQSTLFQTLNDREQEWLAGGGLIDLALPTQLSVRSFGYSSEGFIATDGRGNGVKLEDLLDYLKRTVG